jgi:hypothetical protein
MVFVRGADGLHAIEVHDGSNEGDFGASLLAARLTAGGDLGEAYLAGAQLVRLKAGRPLQAERLFTLSSPATAAGLVPAPLTTYVGDQTVLLIETRDGQVRAYQHGAPLWSRPLSGLTFAGDAPFVEGEAGWRPVAPATGDAGAASHPGCLPGPVAWRPGDPYFDCSGGPRPWALGQARGDPLLVWADGRFGKPPGGIRNLGQAVTGRPALSPDGSVLYAPVSGGVLELRLPSASKSMIPLADATAVAVSRDGGLLYVLSAGRLLVLEAAGKARRASYPASGTTIELVAGG